MAIKIITLTTSIVSYKNEDGGFVTHCDRRISIKDRRDASTNRRQKVIAADSLYAAGYGNRRSYFNPSAVFASEEEANAAAEKLLADDWKRNPRANYEGYTNTVVKIEDRRSNGAEQRKGGKNDRRKSAAKVQEVIKEIEVQEKAESEYGKPLTEDELFVLMFADGYQHAEIRELRDSLQAATETLGTGIYGGGEHNSSANYAMDAHSAIIAAWRKKYPHIAYYPKEAEAE